MTTEKEEKVARLTTAITHLIDAKVEQGVTEATQDAGMSGFWWHSTKDQEKELQEALDGLLDD